jgi:hypothetical protein
VVGAETEHAQPVASTLLPTLPTCSCTTQSSYHQSIFKIRNNLSLRVEFEDIEASNTKEESNIP